MSRRLLIFFVALACAAQTNERQLNLDSFEKVWQTVRDKHWDPKINGLDWQAIHDELRPKVEAAKSTAEARAVMSAMLERLNQSHFQIIAGYLYTEMSGEAGEASPGIDVRVLDGHLIVTSVAPDSPAANRGVHAGWEIVRINGREMAPILKRIHDQFAASTLLDLRLAGAALARLQGSLGGSAVLDVIDGNGRPLAIDVERAMPRGKLVSFGNLPPQYLWVDSRKPRPDVGYIAFNFFLDPELIARTMQDGIETCRECRGFVLDLRGNSGGIGGIATGVAGWFIDQAGLQLGTMHTRTATINFAVFPRPDPFRGPLAVLVDGCSASTAEILAGGLKDIHRARIFGSRTAGAALPSIIQKLPNGDSFQYAVANYISQGGQPLEGVGVIPDEEAHVTRRGLLEGHDAALDAALDWIDKHMK
jgi:carboxyl-terminal processing protease